MSMTTWAEYEIKLACKKENPDWDGKSFDYGCSCYQSALKAYKSIMKDEHSGFSFSVTKNILKRLLDGLPLTPIEDTEDNWLEVHDFNKDGVKTYQCTRKSSLFKDVKKDGTVSFHDNDRCYCQEVDNPNDTFYNGFASRMVDEKFPITMPYYPKAFERYKIVVYSFSAKGYVHDNEDYNTRGFLFIVTPDNKTVELGRFFADTKDNGMVEITHKEYLERLECDKKE